MRNHFSESRVFLREYFRHCRTTGSILPSGRSLARALSRYVGTTDEPKQILEVGPGTGPVTRQIATRLGPEDRLDLVELNDAFVEVLRRRLETEPEFQAVAGRTRIFHCPVEEIPGQPSYDAIISGLPLNNFTALEVKRILDCLRGLLRPGGTLSFFEYIAIRFAPMVSGRAERQRLRGVGDVLRSTLNGNEIRRNWIWPNIPPAWVHHVQFAGPPGRV